MKNKRFNLSVFFLIALSSSTLLYADEQIIESNAQSIFTSVMSPYCPGKLLSDCPSAKASELKKTIREELSKGLSKEEVITKLNDDYGEETLKAVPDSSGFGILAWLVPILFLISGLGLGIKFLTKLTKKK